MTSLSQKSAVNDTGIAMHDIPPDSSVSNFGGIDEGLTCTTESWLSIATHDKAPGEPYKKLRPKFRWCMSDIVIIVMYK